MKNFVLTGFSDEIDESFDIQLKEMRALNIDYIEIRGVNGRNITEHSIEEAAALKNQLDKEGIKVSAIGSPIGKIKITDDFEPHFELFKHTLNIAKVLDTKYIRLFSFFMDNTEVSNYRDEVLKRLSAFLTYMDANDECADIVLLHENEKGIYGDVPERCLDLVKYFDSPRFKLIFDPANFVQCGVKTYPDAFDCLKDEVIYMHIKDAKLDGTVVPAGMGNGHIKELLESFNINGYQGFLSLEPHLGYFKGFEDLEGVEGYTLVENSGIDKFAIAHSSLINIIEDIENEQKRS